MLQFKYRTPLVVAGAALMAAACASTAQDTPAVVETTPKAPEVRVQTGEQILPGSQRDLEVNVGDAVFFDTDRYSLTAEARDTLARQAAWLQRYSGVNILVEGHADERGTREYNLALGARRANAVRDFLVSQGVATDRITTVSYGKERPLDPRSTAEAWSKNRRGHTVIVGEGIS